MAKEAVFTMKLEPELRDAFMAAAEAADRPASQIVREFMRDYVQQDRELSSNSCGGKWRSRARQIAAGRGLLERGGRGANGRTLRRAGAQEPTRLTQ